MVLNPQKIREQKIRLPHVFEVAELELIPYTIPDYRVTNIIQRTLTQLIGYDGSESRLVKASDQGALRIEAYGTGFTDYAVKTDSTPAAYSSSHELLSTTIPFQRFQILIETEEASIRFLKADGTLGDDIPLVVGTHSLLVTTMQLQIKDRSVTGGTYHITGFR